MSFENFRKKAISAGPFGSSSSKGWGYWNDGVYSSVSQVVIQFDLACIRWIQFEYVDENGRTFWSERHGLSVPAVTKKHVVKLDYPDEYLTSISGCYSSYISELVFKSNRRTYGPFHPFGSSYLSGNKSFTIETKGCKIVGFHGKQKWFSMLVSIGAYLTPIDGVEHQDDNENLISYPAKPLLPAPQHPTVYATPEKEDKFKQKKETYIISGNQVGENEGNHNGTFVVGSKSKYVVINL